jgi:hypothetical protein
MSDKDKDKKKRSGVLLQGSLAERIDQLISLADVMVAKGELTQYQSTLLHCTVLFDVEPVFQVWRCHSLSFHPLSLSRYGARAPKETSSRG